MPRRIAVAMLAAVLAGPVLPAAADVAVPESKIIGPLTPDEFILAALTTNSFQVEAGRLAAERATNAHVRAFAERMVAVHERALGELSAAAAGDAIEAAAPALAPVHQGLMLTLEGASGDSFDRLYMGMQAETHEQIISLYSDYALIADENFYLGRYADAFVPLFEHNRRIALLIAHHQRLAPVLPIAEAPAVANQG